MTCICHMRDQRHLRHLRLVISNCTFNKRRVSSKTRYTADVLDDVAKNTNKEQRVTLEIKAPTIPESNADCTVAAWPFTLTANSDKAGALNWTLAFTRFHSWTGAGSGCLAVIYRNSINVGERMCNSLSPTLGNSSVEY